MFPHDKRASLSHVATKALQPDWLHQREACVWWSR